MITKKKRNTHIHTKQNDDDDDDDGCNHRKQTKCFAGEK